MRARHGANPASRPARSISDCGYPSSVQRADGKIVTAWYSKASVNHERYHMGVAIWELPPHECRTRIWKTEMRLIPGFTDADEHGEDHAGLLLAMGVATIFEDDIHGALHNLEILAVRSRARKAGKGEGEAN